MKVEKNGSTDMVEFPFDETDKIMDAMKLAEKAGDLKALQWCARRLQWLWQEGSLTDTDKYCYTESLFNTAWAALSKNDPAPDSIAAIINREDEPEPVTAEAAEKALDTVKAYLEETLAKKGLAAAVNTIGILRNTIRDTEDGE